MSILNDRQIGQKVTRLAYEIIEQNFETKKIYLAGINNNGFVFAELLRDHLDSIDVCPFAVEVFRLKINPAAPVSDDIILDIDEKLLKGKTIIIVDDVANTGRTLFYAFRPFMSMLIKKLQVAVLIDRKHKSFPIIVNFVGLTLATTLKDNIEVKIKSKRNKKVIMS